MTQPSQLSIEILARFLCAGIDPDQESLEFGDYHARVFHLLKQMTPDAIEALKLRYVDQLSSKEIAARIQRTDGAARVLLTRSLVRLRKLLSREVGIPCALIEPG